MAFTYEADLTVFRDKLRLYIGDTVENEGPRPSGRNFSDAELAGIATIEGDNINASRAAVYEVLAGEWAQYAMSEKEADLAFDAKGVADMYLKLAKKWRDISGTGSGTGMVTLVREDAYTGSADEYAARARYL